MKSKKKFILIFLLLVTFNSASAQVNGDNVSVNSGDRFTYEMYSSVEATTFTINIEITNIDLENGEIYLNILYHEIGEEKETQETTNQPYPLGLGFYFTYSDKNYWDQVKDNWLNKEDTETETYDNKYSNILGVRTFKSTIDLQGSPLKHKIEETLRYNDNGVLLLSEYKRTTDPDGYEEVVEFNTELKGIKRLFSSIGFKIGLITVTIAILGIAFIIKFKKDKVPDKNIQ